MLSCHHVIEECLVIVHFNDLYLFSNCSSVNLLSLCLNLLYLLSSPISLCSDLMMVLNVLCGNGA